MVATIEDHAGVVSSAEFGPDGNLVATAGSDGTAKIADARSGAALWSIEHSSRGVRSVQFGSDGRTLLTVAGDTATLWDLSRGDHRLDDPGIAPCRISYALERGRLRRRVIPPACFRTRPD